jgi:GTPase Era involved in 16S rRNA processing
VSNKKKKPKLPLKKYEVTITREIQHHAVVEVEAADEEAAKELAVTVADHPHPHNRHWQEDHVIDQTFRVKERS